MYLSSNFITAIPQHLSLVTRLRVLDLRKNQISAMENLTNLPLLEELSLSCNKITHINPAAVCLCPRLRFLGLFGNRLENLANTLDVLARSFPNVKELLLNANPCAPLADDAYRAAVLARLGDTLEVFI